ncbi:MAG TPA: ferritin-like domain-containing protein [Bacillota bacterium]
MRYIDDPDCGPSYRDLRLVEDLNQALNGEYSAIECYQQLANLASCAEERRRILEIRQDEINHFQTFSRIYTTLTGQQPCPQMTEECPEKYCDALEAAFNDEQQTVDFYLDIADRAVEPNIKARFQRAAADEQNHAVWFSHFYSKNCLED